MISGGGGGVRPVSWTCLFWRWLLFSQPDLRGDGVTLRAQAGFHKWAEPAGRAAVCQTLASASAGSCCCVTGRQVKSGNALLSTPGTNQTAFFFVVFFPAEAASGRCGAPTAPLTLDKQVGAGTG